MMAVISGSHQRSLKRVVTARLTSYHLPPWPLPSSPFVFRKVRDKATLKLYQITEQCANRYHRWLCTPDSKCDPHSHRNAGQIRVASDRCVSSRRRAHLAGCTTQISREDRAWRGRDDSRAIHHPEVHSYRRLVSEQRLLQVGYKHCIHERRLDVAEWSAARMQWMGRGESFTGGNSQVPARNPDRRKSGSAGKVIMVV
jgi:hypothetical protein